LRPTITLDDEKQQKQTQPTQLLTHNHTNLPLLTVSSSSTGFPGQRASSRAHRAISPRRGRAQLELKKRTKVKRCFLRSGRQFARRHFAAAAALVPRRCRSGVVLSPLLMCPGAGALASTRLCFDVLEPLLQTPTVDADAVAVALQRPDVSTSQRRRRGVLTLPLQHLGVSLLWPSLPCRSDAVLHCPGAVSFAFPRHRCQKQ